MTQPFEHWRAPRKPKAGCSNYRSLCKGLAHFQWSLPSALAQMSPASTSLPEVHHTFSNPRPADGGTTFLCTLPPGISAERLRHVILCLLGVVVPAWFQWKHRALPPVVKEPSRPKRSLMPSTPPVTPESGQLLRAVHASSGRKPSMAKRSKASAGQGFSFY